MYIIERFENFNYDINNDVINYLDNNLKITNKKFDNMNFDSIFFDDKNYHLKNNKKYIEGKIYWFIVDEFNLLTEGEIRKSIRFWLNSNYYKN